MPKDYGYDVDAQTEYEAFCDRFFKRYGYEYEYDEDWEDDE